MNPWTMDDGLWTMNYGPMDYGTKCSLLTGTGHRETRSHRQLDEPVQLRLNESRAASGGLKVSVLGEYTELKGRLQTQRAVPQDGNGVLFRI